MNLVTGSLVYVIVWWIMLLAVLPWGNRIAENHESGFATSAPENPKLWSKVAITTVLTTIAWIAIYTLLESGLLSHIHIGP